MEELFNMIYVEGDILSTLVKLFILVLAFDFLLSFSAAIKSIKESIS